VDLATVVDALAEQLRETSPWVYLHFRAVPASSRLVQESRQSRLLQLRQTCGSSNAIDVSTGDHLRQALTSNMRSNLRRKRKRLETLGRIEFVTVTEPAALDEAYQGFLDTEAAGWKSVSGGKRAVKLHADQTTFYRTLMKLKAEEREAHIHLLLLDDTPIASDYCIVSRGTSYSLKHGYDERYAEAAPGNLLRAYTIEYYQAAPSIHTLDLISAWSWHERWHPTVRPIYDVKIFNRSASGRLLHAAVSAKRSADALRSRGRVQIDTR
jgi:CelD/BcsL family acetyltransferase involved in cellulose biosynthesis